MKRGDVIFGGFAVLIAGLGIGILVEWRAGLELRSGNLALLRERAAGLALQSEIESMDRLWPSAGEIARLESVRTALPALRRKVDVRRLENAAIAVILKRGAARYDAGAGAQPPRAASAWKNAGRATPEAAVQTLFWAGGRGDVRAISELIAFSPDAREKAMRAIAESGDPDLPTPELAMASMIEAARRMQPAAIGLVGSPDERGDVTIELSDGPAIVGGPPPQGMQRPLKEGAIEMAAELVVPGVSVTLRPDSGGWKLLVPDEMVARFVARAGTGRPRQ
jgi:hypothetical protein